MKTRIQGSISLDILSSSTCPIAGLFLQPLLQIPRQRLYSMPSDTSITWRFLCSTENLALLAKTFPPPPHADIFCTPLQSVAMRAKEPRVFYRATPATISHALVYPATRSAPTREVGSSVGNCTAATRTIGAVTSSIPPLYNFPSKTTRPMSVILEK